MGAIPKNRDLSTGFLKTKNRLSKPSKAYDKEMMQMSNEELFAYSKHLKTSISEILKSIHTENQISKEKYE